MFVAAKPLTESARQGPPIKHAPGDVLERWAEWPYRVRVALLHAEMAIEKPDIVAPNAPGQAFTPSPADESVAADALDPPSIPLSPAADETLASSFACQLCDGRTFINAPALKRHNTRMHSDA